MAKKDKNSLNLRSSVYGTPTINTLELKAGANKLGEWFLLGLGAFGKLATAPFTLRGPTSSTIYKSKELLDKEQTIDLKSEELLGKAMTWVSPLNYGAALATGNGLNARKGEEEVASWSPAWQAIGRLGELYAGPKAIKGVKATPRVVVNAAAKAGVKPAKAAVVAREINKGIKQNTRNGKIEVTEDYFNSPDKWYRITETPEKYGIMEQGKNVTTHDASQTYGTINGWRSSMLRAPITKSSEGFIKRPHKIELGIRRKNGQAHGNTSQAAKGKLWGGTTSGSNLFPEGIIEGQAPSMINYGIDRTNFVITPWELVPNGGRVGFHTGEMPMSNLGWFLKTKNGTYTYEPIIPEKRIEIKPSTKLLRVVSEGTYPWYRGRLYSVKEVVNSDGTVNPRQAMRIQHEVSRQFPGSYKMEHRLENPEWHQNDPTTYQHTKNVARSAWYIDPPLGFTKQDLMIAALGHDFGKIVAGDGHAQIGADLAKQVFPDLTEAQYKAIAEHMETPKTSLGKVTKAADMLNGRDFNYLLLVSPELYNKVFRKPSKNNIVGASLDYSMKDSKGMDFIKQFFALLKINGKEYTLEGLKDAKNVQQGLPEYIQSYLNLNTVERAVRAMRKNGYSEREILLYVDKVNEEMNKVKVGMYSDLEYNAAGALDFGGFYNSDTNFISINKDALLTKPAFTPNYIMKHEGRHLIDYNTSMTDDVINILEKAYDKDFLEIPKHEDAGSLKDYLHMDRERVTTNRDAREVLLSNLEKHPGEFLNLTKFVQTSSGKYKDMVDFLNELILYAEPEDIINAVENSNGYGKRYINYLKKNNKLTPTKIEQLRLAMIHVPSYLLPVAGGYTLYNIFNQPQQQLQYLKQGGKMNILEFLKNGSGIHIKKKNRGKFTSYCGGKVTDECIRKAKASGNPTLVKRATFANNARHFKHKEGGSIEKLEKGSWISKGLNFLNESGLGKTLVEGGLSFLLSSSQNKSIAGATDVAKAELDKEKQEASDYALLMATKKALEMLLMDPNNPNAFGGSIVLNYIRLQLYNEYLNSINLDIANRKALLDMLSLQMLSENTSGAISGIIQSGLGVVGNLLGGKKDTSSTNGTSSSTKSIVLPKLTSNKWAPSTSLSNPVLGNNALGSMPNYTSLLNVKK